MHQIRRAVWKSRTLYIGLLRAKLRASCFGGSRGHSIYSLMGVAGLPSRNRRQTASQGTHTSIELSPWEWVSPFIQIYFYFQAQDSSIIICKTLIICFWFIESLGSADSLSYINDYTFTIAFWKVYISIFCWHKCHTNVRYARIRIKFQLQTRFDNKVPSSVLLKFNSTSIVIYICCMFLIDKTLVMRFYIFISLFYV